MPRQARVLLPHYPHHIVQRGHNRQVVFAETRDYQYYLDTLRIWKTEYKVKVYAYCLMTNHVHLILEPANEVAVLGKLMKRLAGRQTRYVNRLEGRSGTLWEGRYKSSPIQTEQYFLACCRYVELNPLRAGMVTHPSRYRWSSFPPAVGITDNGWLDVHDSYVALGTSPKQRRDRYVAFVEQGMPENELLLFRSALQRGQLTGDARFIDQVERMIGRRIEHRAPGKQPKTPAK